MGGEKPQYVPRPATASEHVPMSPPNRTPASPILIVGAGIGGLTAALALLRLGLKVIVCEQAPALGDVGAGVQISANGARVLGALGLEGELRRVWCEPEGKEVRLWSSGQSWNLFDLGAQSVARYGAPYFMCHRADLHGLLAAAVRACDPVAIRLGARCVGFSQDARRVTVRLASGEEVSGAALIGADGVHSRIRSVLFGDARPTFSGCIAWRGLVPMERLPARFSRRVGTNWIGPGGHVITYPVRRGELLNFVGIVEQDGWHRESWSDTGSARDCAADFRGWHDDIHAVIGNVGMLYKWALLIREPLPRWTVERVTLLGDAAHPTLPMLAQGACMAIEDGLVLARCLEAYDDLAAALRRYEALRLERTTRLVRGAAESARRFHNPTLRDERQAQSYVEREWREDKVTERYDWIFRYDATAVEI
jgi:salicylate hydroxylase